MDRKIIKIVYICSPYRGDYAHNTITAQKYCRFAVNMGYLPIAPHIYFTQFMNDRNKSERELGMAMGEQLLEMCDEVWVFGITNPSEGMAKEILRAAELNMPIKNGFEIVSKMKTEATAT